MRTQEQARAAYTYLRPQEVADRLSVSRSHVNRLVKDGKLPAINVGLGVRPQYRIDPADLEAFLKRGKAA